MPRNPASNFRVFIAVALSILFLFHYFLYFSAVHFFAIPGRFRLGLALAFFLLPTSFVASTILGRRSQSAIGGTIYVTSAVWLGVAVTVMMAFAAAWVVWGMERLAAAGPSQNDLGAAAVALALGYSAYGVWNARNPRVRHFGVKIKNLPAAWQGKKVVQLSDVHLGHILRAPFLEKLVSKINAESPDAVFITGDLFDGADGHLEQLVAPLNRLRAPRGIFFVTGNHEVYLGVDRALAALATTPVKVLDDRLVTLDGLQIIGISYPRRGAPRDLAEIAKRLGYDAERPSMLLFHSPSQVERVKTAGINLQLAGHTHHGQIFPFQLVTRRVFGKYHRGLHTEGDYTIYTSSGAGTWGPPLRTGNRPEIVVLRLQ